MSQESSDSSVPGVTLTVARVTSLNVGSRDIVGAYIDDPAVEDSVNKYCMLIRGWCVPRSFPLERVQLYFGEDCIGDCTAMHRADVQYAIRNEPFALHSGFSFSVSVLCLPATGTLTLWAKLVTGRRVQIGSIDIGLSIPLLNRPGSLRPLILFSVGRSGSTALMKLLAAHPAISAHMPYPLETRFAQHSYHAMRVGTSLPSSYAPDMMTAFTSRRPAIGPNPSFGYFDDLNDFFHETYAPSCIENHVDLIDAFYRAQKPAGEEEPVYFVEKSTQDPYLLAMLDKITLSRRILLMRDPRDIMVSIRKFNDQTGYQGFGAEQVSSFTEHAELIRSAIEWHVDAAGWQNPQSLVLKYEDMIRHWDEKAEELFSFLGLAHDEETVEKAVAFATDGGGDGGVRHATSNSDKASLGRWIKELEPEEKEICDAVFGDLIEKLGY